MRFLIRVGAFVFLAGVLCLASLADAQLLSTDYRALVSRADIWLDEPVPRSEAGLPIGNGRMGTLLWTEDNKLRMQINRVDVFGNNSATGSFPQRNTDYCCGCAFVDLDFSHTGPMAGEALPVYSAADTKQHLSCYDGLATIEGLNVKVEAQAWQDGDVIALQVTDDRPGDQHSAAAVNLKMLRPPLVKTFDHTATSKIEARGKQIVLTQQFSEGDYFCTSAIAIEVQGRDAEIKTVDDETIRLVLAPGKGEFTVLVASAASFDRKRDLVSDALKQLDAATAKKWEGLAESNSKWWADFWRQSLVHLHSEDGAADRLEGGYHYYLYIMASTSRGKYPTKFNGMLWTTGGDRRSWGIQYWGANQSCFYNNAMYSANHQELMTPTFDMFTGMYDSLARAAQQQWGSQGIFIPETVAFDGLAKLPDDIAAEMRDLYLLRRPWSTRTKRFLDFAAKRSPHSSRWNWMGGGRWVDGQWQPEERGGGPYGPVTHILSRGAKIAYQYWLHYEYTGDKQFLAEQAYPMLAGAAEFYRNYPNLIKDYDGKYHIRHVNGNESVWGGQDTDEEIASMLGILPVVIKASEILDRDAEMRPVWQELLDNLAPMPTSDNPAARPQGATANAPAGGAPTWVRTLSPTVRGRAPSRPDGNTLPEWFFDLCTLETTGPMREIGEATALGYVPAKVVEGRRPGVLSKVPLMAATMGRADAVKVLVAGQMQAGRESPPMANRMDLKEGPQTQNIERMGNAADALTTALCQSFPAGPGKPPVIRVFPAWPKEWDADFKLLQRGGFLLSSSMQDGEIEFVEVESQIGGECRLRNPWDGEAMLHRSGAQPEKVEGSLLTFDTAKGDKLVLAPPSKTLAQLKRTITPKVIE